MLNEGYTLYKSLERCGIELIKRHPDIKQPGRKDGFVVGLNKEGKVDKIEFRNRDDISKLWTTREGMHNSFPMLKLQRPFWKVDKNDTLRKDLVSLKKDEVEKRKLLESETRDLNITHTEVNLWNRILERVKALRPFFETNNKEYLALPELMDRFLCSRVEDFIRDVIIRLMQIQNDIPYALFENILIGNKWDNNKKEFLAEVPLMLDVNNWEDFVIRVASPKFENFVSQCLFKMQDDSSENDINKSYCVSALSGEKVILEKDKFPSPKLPLIGIAYLFAVNNQTPCQTRYKKTSTEIIPIGSKEANAIQDSLNWITEETRKKKTWYPIPGLTGKSDLLIVYLENKPDINVNKAYLLGGVSKNDFSESNYESTAKTAIDALKGKAIVKGSDLLRIFSLRKADPGRTQVSLHRAYTISELIDADKLWREASKNIPGFSLPFFRKEIENITSKQKNKTEAISEFLNSNQSKRIFLSPWCPFPADLVQITQRQWIRFGQDTSSVTGISLGNIYDVFFDLENTQNSLAENLLELTLQRTLSLVIGIGNADHKNNIIIFNADARLTLLKTVSILSIYLNKLGIKKENYMKDTFFNIGKFLSLVDTLHFEWCKNVRGGYPEKNEKEWRKAIPPQLLGNAHLQIALDNPVSAFDILSRRISVYQAWTKKEPGEKVKLAKWAMGEIGKISDMLSQKNLPSSTSSAERAQILLGYLARTEKKTKTDNAEDTKTQSNQ